MNSLVAFAAFFFLVFPVSLFADARPTARSDFREREAITVERTNVAEARVTSPTDTQERSSNAPTGLPADPGPNPTQLTDNSGSGAAKTTVFGYDDLHRLLSASTTAASSTPYLESYAYNALGNFTSKTGQGTYTYAGTNYANPHAPTTVGSTAQTYDNNGNLTAASPWGYAWDYRNRLTSAGNGTATSTYAYDADNQRVRQVVAGITTLYPNKYFSKAGATTTAYLFLPNGDLIATIEGNGTATTTNYVHADHLGSTNAVSAGNGTMAQAIDYYPYGTTRIKTGQDVSQREFIGQFFDESTSMSYLNARYLRSDRGQFISQDPVFNEDPRKQALPNPQSLNSYSYANGNPIVNKDQNGRFSVGLSYNANLEGGFGAFSAAYGSSNLNVVVDPGARQGWIVQSNSGAIGSGFMNSYQGAPDSGKAPFVLGLYGGAGFSLNFSPKMTNPNDIQGIESSTNVNVPLFSFSAQGERRGNATYSIGAGAKGVASVSQYPVYTQISHTYSVNQFVNKLTTQVSNSYQTAVASIQAQIGTIQSKINELKSKTSEKKN